MDLEVHHVELHVQSVARAREFYVDKLGLAVLDDMPQLGLLALRAGPVRISIFGGYEPRSGADDRKCGAHLIFRTADLDRTIQELTARGIAFTGEIVEAGGFIRDIATTDPDGNTVEFAEYLRDPLTGLQ
ncbi:VOC family protein [Lentzea sp. NPDC051213]|uniref:VOC family protein n=1 Tax=Lentzea sp. NPDC051213 TaxID=3364126 RepID=UPI00379DF76B